MNTAETATLWKIAGGIVGVALLVVIAFQLVGLIAYEKIAFTRTFDQPMQSLDIHTENGSVTIYEDRTSGIELTGKGVHGLFKNRHTEELVDSTLTLRSSCSNFGSWCDLNYTLHVPPGLKIRVDSDNGRIRTHAVSAPLELSTDNGSIELNDPAGDLKLSSDNGTIRVNNAMSRHVEARTSNGSIAARFVIAPDRVNVSSSNGTLTVEVPNNGDKYRTDASSDNGRIRNSLGVDSSSPREITARTDNGSITLRPLPGDPPAPPSPATPPTP
jgi:hypothetical protein